MSNLSSSPFHIFFILVGVVILVNLGQFIRMNRLSKTEPFPATLSGKTKCPQWFFTKSGLQRTYMLTVQYTDEQGTPITKRATMPIQGFEEGDQLSIHTFPRSKSFLPADSIEEQKQRLFRTILGNIAFWIVLYLFVIR